MKRRIRQVAQSHRQAVLARDGHRCRWCGAEEDLTLDHVIPVREWIDRPYRSHRQYMGPANLRTLCRWCHQLRNALHEDLVVT